MPTQSQLEPFEHQGFLVVPGLLDDADLRPIALEYGAALADAAERLFARGEISSPHADLPFEDRYIRVLVWVVPALPTPATGAP